MGTKNNPLPYDCYANAKPDEQMFILLGRDPSASLLVRLWIEIRRATGETDEAMLDEAEQCAAMLESWALQAGKQDKVVAARAAFSRLVKQKGRMFWSTERFLPGDDVQVTELSPVVKWRGKRGVVHSIISKNAVYVTIEGGTGQWSMNNDEIMRIACPVEAAK